MAVIPTLPAGDLAPVSFSNPSQGAKDAFAKCHIGDQFSVQQVAGMGQVASTKDLFHYVPLTGREPEFKSDRPAWVIQFQGPIAQPLISEIWTDPICVRFKARSVNSGYFAAQPAMPVAGITPDPGIAPTLALPPLAP